MATDGQSKVVAKSKSGTPSVLEVPDRVGGPSRTRTLDPLIKRSPEGDTQEHQEDLNTGESREQD